jgi:hypothetical protein
MGEHNLGGRHVPEHYTVNHRLFKAPAFSLRPSPSHIPRARTLLQSIPPVSFCAVLEVWRESGRRQKAVSCRAQEVDMFLSFLPSLSISRSSLHLLFFTPFLRPIPLAHLAHASLVHEPAPPFM